MREIVAEDQPFVRDEHTVDEGLALFADQPFKREIIEAVGEGADEVDAAPARRRAGGPATGPVISTYRNSPTFVDLCRGPARAVDRPARALQAHAGGRRVLARRREAPAAAAHLRHRLGVRGGAGGAPAPAGGGRAARPPQARRRARPVLLPRRDRLGPGRLPPQGRHRPPADGGLLAPAPRRGRLRVRQHARTSPRPSCSRPRATWSGSPTGMYPPMELDGGQRVLPQADELPVPHPHLPQPAALLPRAADAALRVRDGLPLREVRASSTG